MNLTKIETTTWVGKELYYYKTIDSTNVKAAAWLTKDELKSVEWLPADITLIDKIRSVI